MSPKNPTRRALIGAATTALAYAGGAAIVGTGLAVASEARGQMPAAVSPELAALIRKAEASQAAFNRYERGPWEAARARMTAQVETVPHITLKTFPLPDHSEPHKWTTANADFTRYAKHTAPERRSFYGPGADEARVFYRHVEKLATAAKWRERKIARIGRDTGYNAACDESDRLCLIVSADEDAVANFPVRSATDLAAIAAFLDSRGIGDDENAAKAYVAAIRRLAAKEAQA